MQASQLNEGRIMKIPQLSTLIGTLITGGLAASGVSARSPAGAMAMPTGSNRLVDSFNTIFPKQSDAYNPIHQPTTRMLRQMTEATSPLDGEQLSPTKTEPNDNQIGQAGQTAQASQANNDLDSIAELQQALADQTAQIECLTAQHNAQMICVREQISGSGGESCEQATAEADQACDFSTTKAPSPSPATQPAVETPQLPSPQPPAASLACAQATIVEHSICQPGPSLACDEAKADTKAACSDSQPAPSLPPLPTVPPNAQACMTAQQNAAQNCDGVTLEQYCANDLSIACLRAVSMAIGFCDAMEPDCNGVTAPTNPPIQPTPPNSNPTDPIGPGLPPSGNPNSPEAPNLPPDGPSSETPRTNPTPAPTTTNKESGTRTFMGAPLMPILATLGGLLSVAVVAGGVFAFMNRSSSSNNNTSQDLPQNPDRNAARDYINNLATSGTDLEAGLSITADRVDRLIDNMSQLSRDNQVKLLFWLDRFSEQHAALNPNNDNHTSTRSADQVLFANQAFQLMEHYVSNNSVRDVANAVIGPSRQLMQQIQQYPRASTAKIALTELVNRTLVLNKVATGNLTNSEATVDLDRSCPIDFTTIGGEGTDKIEHPLHIGRLNRNGEEIAPAVFEAASLMKFWIPNGKDPESKGTLFLKDIKQVPSEAISAAQEQRAAAEMAGQALDSIISAATEAVMAPSQPTQGPQAPNREIEMVEIPRTTTVNNMENPQE